jgi:bacteriorhodopsin
MKIDLSRAPGTDQRLPRFPEATTIVKLVGFVVTGMLCVFSAIMTTVVESGGFWQYFWLGACISLFVCAFSCVIWATKDGLRIDHRGLSFEPPKLAPVPQETRISEDR